jgi:hypothetical protein
MSVFATWIKPNASYNKCSPPYAAGLRVTVGKARGREGNVSSEVFERGATTTRQIIWRRHWTPNMLGVSE